MKRWLGAPAILTMLACMHACAPSEAPEPGRLVIVGGALQADNADVYQAVVDGRLGDGPICVIPTAGSDPAESIQSASETLGTYVGAEAVRGIPISTEDPSLANDPTIAGEMASCSGFYFTGGSQTRILDVFLPQGDTTLAYRALWARWQEGAVLAGSSAGAAMMSSVMIAGGGSDEAVANGVTTESGEDGVYIRDGMGFFEHAMLDQHFLARGRIGRLLVAVLGTESLPLGLGIDENTALIVDGDSAVVAGASGVVVVDGRQAQRSSPRRGTGLRVTLASAGDVLDLRTFVVRRSGAGEALPSTDTAVQLPDDPFARWAFLHLMADLASSPDEHAVLSMDGATLTVGEAADFSSVMTAPDGGVQETPAGLSAGPFLVDLMEGS